MSSLAVGELDDLYAFGSAYDGSSEYDWMLRKYDKGGTEDTSHWAKQLAAGDPNYDAGLTILVDY